MNEYLLKEKILYLGKYYRVEVSLVEDDEAYYELSDNTIHIYLKEINQINLHKAIKKFYYKECKTIVESRVKIYQKEFKTKAKSIKISDNNSNWGSCDSLYRLTFNWKLSMAPLDVIDYVVVHELCHMVHLNHDRSFWRLVGKHISRYEEKKEWLDINTCRMVI
ncbi:MAG TPA: M48 family metallopeptidase [Clostridiales bacterium]|nr:M48 family metallopeptidase [Clostridiales bacterium]